MSASTVLLCRRTFLRGSAAVVGAGIATSQRDATLQSAESSELSGWQLGCFTRPFAQFSYADAIAGIADAGFSAVGLMSARLSSGNVRLADASDEQLAEIRERAAERDLSIAATYYGGPPVKDSLQAGVAALRELIDRCRQVGCATILLGGTGDEALFDRYYEAVRLVCDAAAENQVSLVLKPHGGLNATGPQCRQIIEQVDHPAFRIWYDPGNIFHYSDGQLNPLDDANSVAGLVTGMCVKDFEPPRNVAVNPGTGRVDFPELMQRLQAGGFQSGPLIVETLAPGDLEQTREYARQARVYLESVLRG